MVFFHDNTGAAAQYGPSGTAKTAIQRGETGLAAVTNGPFGRAIKQGYANTLALSALTSGSPSWPEYVANRYKKRHQPLKFARLMLAF